MPGPAPLPREPCSNQLVESGHGVERAEAGLGFLGRHCAHDWMPLREHDGQQAQAQDQQEDGKGQRVSVPLGPQGVPAHPGHAARPNVVNVKSLAG